MKYLKYVPKPYGYSIRLSNKPFIQIKVVDDSHKTLFVVSPWVKDKIKLINIVETLPF